MKIEQMTAAVYEQIVDELPDYWGDDRTRGLHHPMFVHEFRETAFAIRIGQMAAAYLLGFVARDNRYGYIHLAAVRGSHRRRGMGRALYQHFFEYCRARDVRLVKAITRPGNRFSIQFHKRMGFRLFGETIEHGVPVIKNYSGHREDRVVMFRRLGD